MTDIDNLRGRAQRRWSELQADHPELHASIALQRRLISRTLDALERLEAGSDPLLTFPGPYVAAKLARGVPALRGETIPPAVEILGPLLGAFSDDIASAGGGDAATHVRRALDDGKIEPSSWLVASLARDRNRVLRGANQMALSADLLWLIGELSVAPLAHLLATSVLSGVNADDGRLPGWGLGICPACGSWPALAEQRAGLRTLRCSFCGTGWRIATDGCIYCDEADGDRFAIRAPSVDQPGRRLELCDGCGGYLKDLEVAAPLTFPLASIEDLATSDLDAHAMKSGYGRPQLPDVRPEPQQLGPD